MRGELALSTSAWGGRPLRVVLEDLHAVGVRDVELSVGPLPDPDPLRCLEEFAGRGLRFRLHHNFPLFPAPRRIDLCRALDLPLMERLIRLAGTLGIAHYTLHPGKIDPARQTLAEAEARLWAHLARLLPIADRHGVQLGIETMYPVSSGPPHLLSDVAGIERYLSRAARLGMGLAVDLAHLGIGVRHGVVTPTYVEHLLSHPLTIEVHVSDNDGAHDLHTHPGPDVWWRDAMARAPVRPVVYEGRMRTIGEIPARLAAIQGIWA